LEEGSGFGLAGYFLFHQIIFFNGKSQKSIIDSGFLKKYIASLPLRIYIL